MGLTITEALAEIKTVQKRIEKKREFAGQFLARQDGIRDPLEKDGGSAETIKRERQAIGDLEQRILDLRRGISRANDATTITLAGATRSVSEWLIWRRDVAPSALKWLQILRATLNKMREDAKRQGFGVVTASAVVGDMKPTDFVVNIDERALADDIEKLEEILGNLDGQLSLKNATVAID